MPEVALKIRLISWEETLQNVFVILEVYFLIKFFQSYQTVSTLFCKLFVM